MVGTTKGSRQYLKGLSVDEAYAALAEEMSTTYPVGAVELRAIVDCWFEAGCDAGAVLALKMRVNDVNMPERFDESKFREALEVGMAEVIAEWVYEDPIANIGAVALPGLKESGCCRELVGVFTYEELIALEDRVARLLEVMAVARARKQLVLKKVDEETLRVVALQEGEALPGAAEDGRLEEAATKEPPSSRLVMGGGIDMGGLG